MATGYKHLRCPGCDGTLKYLKEEKVWECIYCGNRIHREEEYDGLYTIKNVVKQVLMDLANQRIDSAQKNLTECEKIASDYVGTVIAEICYRVFLLITPGACSQGEMKSVFGQVKRYYEKLKSIDPGISSEEEALYESFEGSGDCFGVLVLVFDTIRASAHLDFARQMLEVSSVYSRSLNASLLNYGLKNNDTAMVDGIFANSDNLECRSALMILLNSYPDSDNKQNYMRALMSKAELRPDDFKQFNEYLENTSDSLNTRIALYESAAAAGQIPTLDIVTHHILNDPAINEAQVQKTYDIFCASHPKDAELYDLISDIYCRHSGPTANKEMDLLMEHDLFIKLNDKVVRVMIGRQDWTVEDRITMLEKSEQCKLDNRGNDAIMTEILLRIKEPTDTRLALIKAMTKYIETVSTNTVNEYLLKCSLDGDRKQEVMQVLMDLGLNVSFFRETVNRYLQTSTDPAETKKAIGQMFSDKGFVADGSMLLDMACKADDSNMNETISMIQKSVDNGSRINAEFLNKYLETVPAEKYNSALIALLATPISQVSDDALAKYVLHAEEDLMVKLQNTMVFAEKNGKPFGSSTCTVMHLGAKVGCNLFQAYVLTTDDSAAAVEKFTDAMKAAKAKLNPMITVNGTAIKFKKYITDKKSQLSPITLTLCEENGVFKMFF